MTEEIKEIWKPIKGYEGLYEISSLGRVRNKDKLILTPKNNNSIRLIKNKVQKSLEISKLVFEYFGKDYWDYAVIVHKNNKLEDNRIDNLFITEYSVKKNNEFWKTINKYKFYDISNYGRVRNNKLKTILYPYKRERNLVTLYNGKYHKQIRIDEIVAFTFLNKNPKKYSEVLHINNDVYDDSLLNIQLTDSCILSFLNEKWISIKGFENLYEISSQGRVKALSRTKIIKFNGKEETLQLREKLLKFNKIEGNAFPYYSVTLYNNNEKEKRFFIHRLVALNFISDKYSNLEVNHINGDKLDNRVENLEWVTHSENILHAQKIGLKPIADKCIRAKLKNDDVLKIREIGKNKSVINIAREFGVSKSVIYNIIKRRSWKSL